MIRLEYEGVLYRSVLENFIGQSNHIYRSLKLSPFGNQFHFMVL